MAAKRTIEAAVEYFASRSHDAWRRQFLKANRDQKGRPRMRLRGGKMVDINQPWRALDPAAKADNMVAAYDAYEAVTRFPKDRDKAAAYVHRRWIKRNKSDPNQPKALFRPYDQLPDLEKDKDRAHVDRMKAALAAVKKSALKQRLRKTATKPLQVDAATTRRLEAVAKRLSLTLGRTVSTRELLRAGMQAILPIYEAASARRKKR